MLNSLLHQVLSSPAAVRPAILEGRWAGDGAWQTWLATYPVSVLEGGLEAFQELAPWITRHAQEFPAGAAIGFLSYELGRHFEPVPLVVDSSLPDVSFAYYPFVHALPFEETRGVEEPSTANTIFAANFDRVSYRNALTKIKAYIAAGDIYQANLTQQFTVNLGGTPAERIFERVRRSLAPFRAFLRSPARTIISNSPERFFRVSGDRILASPVKGTIARQGDEEDKVKSKLLASAKDRCENVMIVDLLRNDLGRICNYNSIGVQLWETERLPHLLHLVSHVEGTLQRGVGIREILRALFPCGSITGAPKIRAMQILAETEQVARGVSMGALGLIRGLPGSDYCTMDFSVAIRTMCIANGRAVFNVGGGIVADSQDEGEYAELMLKAQPLLEALACC
jgi:anthranilate/para-aminobenzoate synthase component I